MAHRRIFTVGQDLPGEEFEYVPFESDQTLLDADIVVFWPTFGSWSHHSGLPSHQGKPVMSTDSSARVLSSTRHWRAELKTAADAGKLVIVFLTKPEEAHRDIGNDTWSGSGRTARKIVNLDPINSYDVMPVRISGSPISGTKIQTTPAAALIATYWKEFGAMSPYVATVDGDYGEVLLQTPGIARTVAAVKRTPSGGALLFLPPLSFDEDAFTRYDKNDPAQAFWNAAGEKFGKRVLATLVGIAKAIAVGTGATPPPTWTAEVEFRIEEEARIQSQMDTVAAKIVTLTKKRDQLQASMTAAVSLRALLYEQGKPLENAILDALQHMAFTAEGFSNSGSEFDAVFQSAEGRCLGEAEGKDNKAINIDKLSQLERNIQEDFARDEVSEHAKGVLFGNAYRLVPLAERAQYFTDKCVAGARRARVSLVRTPDLFYVARYLKEHPDAAFAKSCREAIFTAEGDVVVFPSIPVL